jgi:hypothetical protein
VQRALLNRQRHKVVAAMYERAPWCARCGSSWVDMAGHERRGRTHGADITDPDCLLCHRCNLWCEDNPVEAANTGWKISAKHAHHPALTDDQAVTVFGHIYNFTGWPRSD